MAPRATVACLRVNGLTSRCALLDLPDELIDLVCHNLAPPYGTEPHDDFDIYGGFRKALAALCLVCQRFKRIAKPLLYRSIVVKGDNIHALQETLDHMGSADRHDIIEIMFPLVATSFLQTEEELQLAVTASGILHILALLPALQHIFFYDLRMSAASAPASFTPLPQGRTLRKLSLYVGDSYYADELLELILVGLEDCNELQELDIAGVQVAASGTDVFTTRIPSLQLPPVRSLTLITCRPTEGATWSPISEFWIAFVAAFAPTLRYLAINVGDYLSQLVAPVADSLNGLSLTPFTECYDESFPQWEMASLRCLALGYDGWAMSRTKTGFAPAYQYVEYAVIAGFDAETVKMGDVTKAVAGLRRLKLVIVTETEESERTLIAALIRISREALGLPSVPVVAVSYGELDMKLLDQKGIVAYKYARM